MGQTIHNRNFKPTPRLWLWFCLFIFTLSFAGCTPAAQSAEPAAISATIIADGQQKQISLPAGATVQTALEKAGVALGTLDRVEPPTFTALTSAASIQVTRVREEFEVEETTIAFETQTVYNESLPDGQTMQIQPGQNGVQQITYRRVFENDVEISRTIFKTLVLSEARPEILMVGVQTPFIPITISGRLAYLTAGNAWVMEGTTGTRRPVVTSGDLDGRVFALSANGEWLLYTRKTAPNPAAETQDINSLWVVRVTDENPVPVDLKAKNVIHFADWVPYSQLSVVYSTVEPRSTAPGWQANNDLQRVSFNNSGRVVKQEEILPASSGGIYGWWGTTYAWSPQGKELAYARPDSVGLVDVDTQQLIPLVDIIPFQTRGDWAWVPGLGWSSDSRVLFTVVHTPLPGLSSDEASPLFDLTALVVNRSQAQAIPMVSPSGMFAYPTPYTGENPRLQGQIAYLQAIFSEQSDSSRYRLVIMDRDGSNKTTLFPDSGSPGLDPQKVIWGPQPQGDSDPWVAVYYQGNLHLVNPLTGQSQQVTGDGSIGRIDWK